MNIEISKCGQSTRVPGASESARQAGVTIPCLRGFTAKTFHCREDIPRDVTHDFLLEYIATQATVYERVNGTPLDPKAHLKGFWANIHRVIPPQGSYYLVWSDRGDVVGTGALRRVDEDTGEMKHLYVSPKARGTGLGRWILEQRLRDARALGIKSIIADTLIGNVEMPALYKSVGFDEVIHDRRGASLSVMPHLKNALRYFEMQLS